LPKLLLMQQKPKEYFCLASDILCIFVSCFTQNYSLLWVEKNDKLEH